MICYDTRALQRPITKYAMNEDYVYIPEVKKNMHSDIHTSSKPTIANMH